jgi:hypothetical protein
VITWTAAEATTALRALADWCWHHPTATITRAPTGNLAVLNLDGRYIGFLNTRTGEINIDEDNPL